MLTVTFLQMHPWGYTYQATVPLKTQFLLKSRTRTKPSLSGLIPVPVRPPHANNISTTLPTVKMVIDVSKSRAVLTTHTIAKGLRSKEAVGVVDIKSWPTVVEVDDAPKKKLMNPYRAPTPEMIAYLDFSVSTTGMLSGVKVRSSFHCVAAMLVDSKQ